MSKKITFSAQRRSVMGKKTKQLRQVGLIPANVSGFIDQPIAVEMKRNAFIKLYQEVGETSLVFLRVEGESQDHPTLISDLTYDPVTEEVLHAVFKQVNLAEKIEAEIPVVLIGENSIPNTAIVKAFDSITVEALPTDLPEHFTFDISKLTDIGQTFTFADLEYDQDKINLKVGEEELQSPIIILQEQKEIVEEEPAAVEGAEAPAEAGAESAEGASAPTEASAEKAEPAKG
jgi:large subunit ribosomal protein L25